jgi:hypothetical protein
MPRVGEANSLSQELQKGMSFQTKIEQSVSVGVGNSGVGSTVMVHVTNRNTGLEYLWGKQKFINRVFLMREVRLTNPTCLEPIYYFGQFECTGDILVVSLGRQTLHVYKLHSVTLEGPHRRLSILNPIHKTLNPM